jgi:hypothetical protein
MRLPNQRSLAQPERIDRPVIWQLFGGFLLSLIFLAGCAGGTSGTSGFSNFFNRASPTPSPTAAALLTATPSSSASPQAEETTGQSSRKTAKQARAASENAANASKEAAQASAAAARASKQAASVANRIEGTGPTSADVSLEAGSATTISPNPAGAIRNATTPAASPSLITSARDSSARTTPTASSPALEPMGAAGQSDLAKAAKLIRNVDAIDKRVDRKNLSADDSQRDILAQKLLEEAKKALVDRDSVAATSLATKASTLFEPLPKLAESSVAPPAP